MDETIAVELIYTPNDDTQSINLVQLIKIAQKSPKLLS